MFVGCLVQIKNERWWNKMLINGKVAVRYTPRLIIFRSLDFWLYLLNRKLFHFLNICFESTQ
jgi:hypothetical protein